MLKLFLKKPTLSALTQQATDLAEQFRALAEDKTVEAGEHKHAATEHLLKADAASADAERAERIAGRIEGYLA